MAAFIDILRVSPIFGVLLSVGTFFIGQILFKNQKVSSSLHPSLLP